MSLWHARAKGGTNAREERKKEERKDENRKKKGSVIALYSCGEKLKRRSSLNVICVYVCEKRGREREQKERRAKRRERKDKEEQGFFFALQSVEKSEKCHTHFEQ